MARTTTHKRVTKKVSAKTKLKVPKLGTALTFKRHVDAHGWAKGIKLMKTQGITGIKF